MKPNSYQPNRGDIIWVHFTPHAGTEQAGRRPGLVLSAKEFNIATGLAFVCPITNQGKGSRFEVPVPRGVSVTGFILSDHLKSIDWIAREAEYAGAIDQDTMCEVLGRIEAVMGIDLVP